jgi:hypothetical protein
MSSAIQNATAWVGSVKIIYALVGPDGCGTVSLMGDIINSLTHMRSQGWDTASRASRVWCTLPSECLSPHERRRDVFQGLDEAWM